MKMVVKHVENVDIVDAANTFDKDIFDKKDCTNEYNQLIINLL